MQYRAATNNSASSFYSGDKSSKPPAWMRLVREGNTFTGYTSDDGVTWKTEGQVDVLLPSAIQVGVVVNSHVDGTLMTAVFDNISVTPAAP